MPLTDKQQAIIMFVSALLLALGTVYVPLSTPYHDIIALIFFLAGALGMAIKESLGTAPPSQKPPLSPIPPMPPTPPTPQPPSPPPLAPYTNYMQEIGQVKVAGFLVFQNDMQPHGYVYRFVGIWYNNTGTILSIGFTNPPAGTGTQL